jgi:hypothetical protein
MSGLWPWDANADGASYGNRLDETQRGNNAFHDES